jgi:hypothetical protein
VTIACLVLLIIGALWSVHMRANWRHRLNHRTGLIVVLSLLAMLLTGIGIFYFGDEQLSLTTSVVHTLLGLAAAPFCIYHIVVGRKSARRTLEERLSHRLGRAASKY